VAAEWACSLSARPSVSTMAWRLRPLMFLPPSQRAVLGKRSGDPSLGGDVGIRHVHVIFCLKLTWNC
jgi:hypothetical protein